MEPGQIALGMLTPAEVTAHIKAGHFGVGSMLPKIQAATAFASKKRIEHYYIARKPRTPVLKRRAGTLVQG